MCQGGRWEGECLNGCFKSGYTGMVDWKVGEGRWEFARMCRGGRRWEGGFRGGRWEGGCGKFVLIQSGGGDCFHRYIGGITALLPSFFSTAAKQQKRPKKLLRRSSCRGSGPGPVGSAGPWRAGLSWLLRLDHTGGFRAAGPPKGSGSGGVGAAKGPEPSQWS